MKQTSWFLAVLAALVLAMAGWVAATETKDPVYSTFVDTSGQLTLKDVASARYIHRFAPRAPGPLQVPGDGALWIQISLQGGIDQQLLLENPLLSRAELFLLRNDNLIEEYLAGASIPESSGNLPHPGFAFLLGTSEGAGYHAYLRLQNDFPLTTVVQVSSVRDAATRQSASQALQGILIGLLLALAVHGLLHGVVSRDPFHLLLALAALTLGASALSGISWIVEALPGLRGHSAGVLQLVSYPIMALILLSLLPRESLHAKGSVPQSLALVSSIMGLVILIAALDVSLLNIATTVLRLTLPLLAAILMLFLWLRHQPVDKAFVVSIFFMLGSFVAEYRPSAHPFGDAFVILLLWLALVSYAWGLHKRLQRRLARQSGHRQSSDAYQAERRTKAEFLARISHEIRTPMNGVLGMSELLLDTALSAKQRDYVQTIHGSGSDLLYLINEILDISRLESGEMILESVRFDLHGLINDCLETVRSRAGNQNIELISYVHPEVPRSIEGDPTRLRQVLTNLLNNSLRFTVEGEILLVVRLDTEEQGSLLRFAVQDTGNAMPDQARESLLKTSMDTVRLLEQTDQSGHMGLLIANQLVRMMGGKIGIKYASEQGNSIWFSLDVDAQTSDDSAESPAEGHPLENRRTLIVDDNATCRKVLQNQCSAWGMHVETLGGGKEALALLRTQAHLGNPFEILLVDQAMPGMSGLELASRIKDDPAIRNSLLIIMLTGVSHAPSRVISRAAGVRRILSKPVAGYTLRATLVEEWQQHLATLNRINAAVPESAAESSLGDFRVLVAEDNAISTKVIRGMLAKLGLQATAVQNGHEAVEAVKAGHYDLVLMDCEMPELDGFAAAKRIREWEKIGGRQPVPIIALTAHILPEHRERSRRAGMNAHMAKPVELTQLREQVDYWVGRKQENKTS
ncbi:response regulator [Halopseudomonas salina]|uniref:histidine kinase n=1 Tax=Halopseudomonas salina TaxID=1323744 RepID=A0ABQ1PPF7_9GAMM|nr:response regulator [Halopseudomonas salina]GGD00297.1 hybrid sensor histidine kinase/response regulator [Halopseudomonas salina]